MMAYTCCGSDGRLEDLKFEVSLSYIAVTCLNTILEKRNEGREAGEVRVRKAERPTGPGTWV